jgi:hypothetical protein
MTPRWFLARNRQKFGPYSMDQLRQFAATGLLLPTDMLLQEGAQQWVAANTLSGRFGTAGLAAQAVCPPLPSPEPLPCYSAGQNSPDALSLPREPAAERGSASGAVLPGGIACAESWPLEEDLILAKALGIDDPGAQSAFLDKACADRADVHARIEQQIAQRRKTNPAPAEHSDPAHATPSFLAGQEETGPFAAAAGQESKEWALPEPGATPGGLGRLGHYEILEVIGRGGMGVVLKAHDEKLQRVVALKVMSAAMRDNPAARQRFVREAWLAAAVTHDHIAAIYSVEEEGPVPYLVMPLITGHSLQKEIDARGPLPAAEVVRIGM